MDNFGNFERKKRRNEKKIASRGVANNTLNFKFSYVCETY